MNRELDFQADLKVFERTMISVGLIKTDKEIIKDLEDRIKELCATINILNEKGVTN